jgi:class 3 adenylate cyclase
LAQVRARIGSLAQVGQYKVDSGKGPRNLELREMSLSRNTLVTKILQLSREDPRHLNELEKFRRSITVMFTDIKGSTEFFEKFGDIAGLAMVHECNHLQRLVVEQHGGRVIKTIGDSVMAAFDDCNEAIKAAIEIQRALKEKNAARKAEEAMLVRIGLHYGTGIVKSDDVFGDVVNVASRVESLAQPLQIIVSDSLQQQISKSKFNVVFLGRFRLKGKSDDRDLFSVQWGEAEIAPLKVAHTIVTGSGVHTARLQRMAPDGSVSAEYSLSLQGVTVRAGDADPKGHQAPPAGARFWFAAGQPMVEDVGNASRIFIRLVATYTLEDGDVILMGTRLFKFVCKPEVAAAATVVAKTVLNVSDLLQEPAAELCAINPDGSPRSEKYPLRQEEVTFGRTNGTYAFDDNRLMSRSHARVYQRGEDFFLEDLNSRNGTFILVRGKAPVPFGAIVLVGSQRFRVVQ